MELPELTKEQIAQVGLYLKTMEAINAHYFHAGVKLKRIHSTIREYFDETGVLRACITETGNEVRVWTDDPTCQLPDGVVK